MTLELTLTQISNARKELEIFLHDITLQDRELYSREEVENMLLDIYALLNNN